MRILVINWQDWNNPFAGGAEVYLYEVFSRILRNGHQVMLLCSRAPGQPRHEFVDGFEIFRIGRRSNFNFLAPAALRGLLRHRAIDVVVDDLNKIPFYSTAFTRKKIVPTVMHLFRKTIFRETNPVAAAYVYAAERLVGLLYRRCDFVAISSSTEEDLRAIGVRRRVHIVHSGIPVDQTTKVAARQDDLVAYVGRVKTYKSIDHFVRAVKIVNQSRRVRAMIVGDGDALEELRSLARAIGVEIEFPGFVSESEKRRIYQTARVVVQPSIKEGWGLTAIEAQSHGTPVVCANSPGLREVVAHDQSGFLYQYGNVEEMAGRIVELLSDRNKWNRFSAQARKWSTRFSWDRSAEIFERVLAGGTRT